GAACLAGTLVEPAVGLTGLAGAVLASLFALIMGFSRPQVEAGLVGVNGLLVGLALGAWFEPTTGFIALVVAASMATAVVAGALGYLLTSVYNLPSLSLPFVIVALLAFLAGHGLQGLEDRQTVKILFDVEVTWWPLWVTGYFRALSAIFFQHTVLPGLIIFAALLLKSRITVFLTLLGFFAGQAFAWALGESFTGLTPQQTGFNLILSCLAVGGIFFIPSPQAFAGGVLASGFGVLLTNGLAVLFKPWGLPVLATPFNLVVIAFLMAARYRAAPKEPRAVDFIPDTPERNLDFHLTRLRRSPGWTAPVFNLPVAGAWRVSQGPDGGPTHRDVWRHAWDFVGWVKGGASFWGQGQALEDHVAYGQPVLAAAPGRVVKVMDGVPDNPIGQENIEARWGNLAVLEHVGGYYTQYSHLMPGSIAVFEGQSVASGQVLGRIGNSGRSPMPHLHFHCQLSAQPGSASAHCEFVNFIERDDQAGRFRYTGSPSGGTVVEKPRANEDFQAAFKLPRGKAYHFEVLRKGDICRETWTVESDLIAGGFLHCEQTGGRCFFSSDWSGFYLTDYLGPRNTGLYAFFLAASRVPFAYESHLIWNDVLPIKVFVKGGLGLLMEFLRPFANLAEVRAEKGFMPPRISEGNGLLFGVFSELRLVTGWGRNGRALRAEAWFSPAYGPTLITLRDRDEILIEVRANSENNEKQKD
ncbi:MAG: urea transporter, partial [Proteobacteria bacterium]|nr:urea transporter [Pseudomonadota bacterium]